MFCCDLRRDTFDMITVLMTFCCVSISPYPLHNSMINAWGATKPTQHCYHHNGGTHRDYHTLLPPQSESQRFCPDFYLSIGTIVSFTCQYETLHCVKKRIFHELFISWSPTFSSSPGSTALFSFSNNLLECGINLLLRIVANVESPFQSNNSCQLCCLTSGDNEAIGLVFNLCTNSTTLIKS